MAAACDFEAIPRSITSAGSVRFFPSVSGFTKPIVTYAWTFGDTGTSAEATPIHAYPVVAASTLYDVSLTVTDSNGGTATLTKTNFIRSDAIANIPAIPNDGTFMAVSVLMNDGTNHMLVNRNPWAGSSYYLLTPVSVDSIDKIGTFTFSLLDIGTATAAEKSLVVEGTSVLAIMGMTATFSGMVRRVSQNLQNGFTSSAKVKVWDLECDSDLARLKNIKVSASALATSGETIIDSPGNIAKRILT
jgi:PKD repeat protein